LKRGDVFILNLTLLYPAPHFLREITGQHSLRLKRPQTFQNNRGSNDRGQDDGPHHDAAGFHDFEHGCLRPAKMSGCEYYQLSLPR
jgi:hypothetical protein